MQPKLGPRIQPHNQDSHPVKGPAVELSLACFKARAFWKIHALQTPRRPTAALLRTTYMSSLPARRPPKGAEENF